jgi:hypothetical protein
MGQAAREERNASQNHIPAGNENIMVSSIDVISILGNSACIASTVASTSKF